MDIAMAEKNTADIGFEKQIWNAACVVQMFCGIPTVLKGELPEC